MTDEQMQRLHDRATRGERLTPEEAAALSDWYDQQDRFESQILYEGRRRHSSADLNMQVRDVTNQIESVTRQIRDTITENDRIRAEIAQLQRQLQLQPAGRPA